MVQIHVRFIVGLDGSDVAPVGRWHPPTRRECDWSRSCTHTSAHLPASFGQNVHAEIVTALRILRVVMQQIQKGPRGKHVIAHRCVYAAGIAGHGRRIRLLLVKGQIRPSVSASITPNSIALLARNGNCGDGDFGLLGRHENRSCCGCSSGRCDRRRRSPPGAGQTAPLD